MVIANYVRLSSRRLYSSSFPLSLQKRKFHFSPAITRGQFNDRTYSTAFCRVGGFVLAAFSPMLTTNSNSYSTAISYKCERDKVVSRVMLPGDANPAGNVHGGTILKMIDEAGSIVTMRHCNQGVPNSPSRTPTYAALARLDDMDFLGPMFIGELEQLEAKVTYASKRSVEVEVCVYAENLMNGTRRRTNRATLWYVPVKDLLSSDSTSDLKGKSNSGKRKIIVSSEIPSIAYESETQQREGQRRYEQQKKKRVMENAATEEWFTKTKISESSNESACENPNAVTLNHLLLPDECFSNGIAQGGVILKLMDNCAGIAAVKYCRTNAVTASMEAVNFLNPIAKGQIAHVVAKPVFTSSKSMQISVQVTGEDLMSGETFPAINSTFVFVSLDNAGKPLNIKPLPPPTTEQEKQERIAAQQRYDIRKDARKTKGKPKAT